jgi:hypothetical protein
MSTTPEVTLSYQVTAIEYQVTAIEPDALCQLRQATTLVTSRAS